ncbi:MAG: 2-C-methyl-D-erythritol 4-phosphate cytidylyltransferase [bacterium]
MANHAIIVAAGQGSRFGGDLPKQFLLLRDRPILAHSLQRFEQSALIEKTVVVAAPAWLSYIEREIAGRFCCKKCKNVVAGGERRQDSVWAGLQALAPAAKDIVIVHDAVRPLFSLKLLERVVGGCEKFDGCIPALSLADTVKQVDGEVITATLARESLKLAQTPQAFRCEALKRAFRRAQRECVHGTDEAALVESSGGRMCWVEGEISNLKITTPHDLKLAEFFMQEIEA